ncbi:hypothetical protein KQ51_00201 [Candidatus Izimaplasma bacterium HR1]|jgi:hypothetical protein|uniref:hypothetical protein n=1 Tax=Candidatus Izimoplasma sp. HR1 TaxID=1541959 RepID=UPI0004F599DC|nr:hypothetical protein KQ51_00201 [Candidatus Izimaplasma bacterium HR1]
MRLNLLFKKLLMSILIFTVLGSFVGISYAYFDNLEATTNENISLGEWGFDSCTKIYTAQEFYDFATASTSSSSDEYCLGNDIDFSSFTWSYLGSFDNNQFNGTFDGKNYTLSNLTIITTDASSTNLSLFSSMDGATIKNVKINNLNMGFTTAYYASSSLKSAIFASQVTGTNNYIENITITDSEVLASNLSGGGGLVAQVEANADLTIKNIKTRNLTVLNNSKRAGGLISRAIKGTGTIVIEDVDFEGYVAAGNATSNTGGIIGTVQNMTISMTRVIVEYTASGTVNLSDGPVSYTSNKYVGGFVGNTQTGSVMTFEDTFFTGELQTTFINLGSLIGRRKPNPIVNDSYYSNAIFGTSNTPSTSSGVLNATEVNATSMPSNAWWDAFKVDFDAANGHWTQDASGRLILIR